MDSNQLHLYLYYVTHFFVIVVAAALLRKYTTRDTSKSAKQLDNDALPAASASTSTPLEYLTFRKHYLIVYYLMVAADWLQGPYVYALYKYYGFSIAEIGQLFIIGFGSSMVVGTVVGSTADRYGRKKLCLLFGVLYSLSCMTKHSHLYQMLLVGRLLGGIATSILYSSFESWLVHTHTNLCQQYNIDNVTAKQLLDTTFSQAAMGNSMVAILSGVVASTVRDSFGPVAPFDVSLLCLLVGSTLVYTTWQNDRLQHSTSDASSNNASSILSTLQDGVKGMIADSRIWLLGLCQSFFEGSMYVFVFMWTPALESTALHGDGIIYHGWIFASFMACALIGSTLFEYLAVKCHVRHEKIMSALLTIAAISLVLPAILQVHTVRLYSFFLFEVCVGMFWPTIMSLRETYITDDTIRSTTMNLFRIPLNAIVVLVLIHIDQLSELQIFATCFVCLSVSLICCRRLTAASDSSKKYQKLNSEVNESHVVKQVMV